MSVFGTVVPTFLAQVAASPVWALVPLFAFALATAALVAARSSLRETTLTSAWTWAFAATATWSTVEMAACLVEPKTAAAWLLPVRLAAMTLSFLPVVSLVGAKRPQHRAWNFVVLSLWVITALPAAESFFLERGPRPEMGAARSWFLWILIALGPINFVATRYALAAALVAAGQIIALSTHLALLRKPLASWPEGVGLVLCSLGLAAALATGWKRRPVRSPYDRLWLEFRDSFGMLWALRVQERINALARQQAWDLELAWYGFVRASDGAPAVAIDEAIEPTLRTTIKGLLRRFVSNAWIARRLESEAD